MSYLKPFFFLLLFSIGVLNPILSQNLVSNPSFETFKRSRYKLKPCQFTNKPSGFNWITKDWNTFKGHTPDIITVDSLIACFYPTPKSGKNMIGLIVYHPAEDIHRQNDYHEMVQGKLLRPMIPGETYQISLWIYQDNKIGVKHLGSVYGRNTPVFPVACNNLGFLFSTVRSDEEEDISQSIEFYELKPQVYFKEIMTSPSGEWKKISLLFQPKKAYTYFVMGNFSLDDNTLITPNNFEEKYGPSDEEKTFWQKPKRIAYYCIDDIDISVYDDKAISIEVALQTDNNYTFRGLSFESGKAVVPNSAFSELDELYEWLKAHSDKKIEISGHTDDVGSAESNLSLSQQRVNAVADYLLEKGISPSNIISKGYGESQPISTNKTKSGRKTNRRVECKILLK